MNRKELIKTNLSEAIKNSGKTPLEIAQLTQISCATIQNYIDKQSVPSIEYFCRIAKVLHLNVNAILGIDRKKLRSSSRYFLFTMNMR